MMARHSNTDKIRDLIVQNLRYHPKDIAGVVASACGISRQAANRHLRDMCDEGILSAVGKTRSRQYTLKDELFVDALLPISGLQEDTPWSDSISPRLTNVPRNVFQILNYGFTEILNNAIDHSGSEMVGIKASRTALHIEMQIIDFGVGIFRKIKEYFELEDEFQAICQLAMGKLTTNPTHHSGEGIFFTSRMFDQFEILSGTLYFAHKRPDDGKPDSDWLMEDRFRTQKAHRGTFVRMKINLASTTKYDSVFSLFANEETNYAFSKTHVPVSLLQYGPDNLVSRSQAKRLLSRFQVFEEVILDFAGVEMLGQAFADEIFRVYPTLHPDVVLIPINASPPVLGMISHALANRAANAGIDISPAS